MPKVGRHGYRQPDNKQYYDVDVNFGSPGRGHTKIEKKSFWMALPEDVSAFLGQTHVYGDTIEVVTQYFNKAIDNYVRANKSERKVIFYKFTYSLMVKDGAYQPYNLRTQEQEKVVSNTKGQFPEQRFGLRYEVGRMITMGTKEFFSIDKQTIDIKNSYGYISGSFIDWTEEREAWFASTYQALSKMIEGAIKFFDVDEKKFLNAIDNNSKLLNYKQ